MPYIELLQRQRLECLTDKMESVEIRNPGELNYLITMLLFVYKKQQGESYSMYNDCVGALENAKLELYRRKISQYEDLKIRMNGDV